MAVIVDNDSNRRYQQSSTIVDGSTKIVDGAAIDGNRRWGSNRRWG